MHDFEEARAAVGSRARPLAAVRRPVGEAMGLRLARTVAADVDIPPGDVSAMDGYAARGSDLAAGVALPVAFEVAAGSAPPPLAAGSVARIFTGAVLPAGADAVVPQERARLERGRVTLEAAEPGACVRPGGEIVRAGDPLLDAGDRLTPSRVALAAAASPGQVVVTPRPRVALLSTGSEVVAPGVKPGVAQIRDSNTPLFAALSEEAGLEIAYAGHVADDLERITAAIETAAAAAELVVTGGGVSVGDFDLIPHALKALDAETVLHGVRMRPGKPILVARLRDRWIVGLPGNPVSALVGWRLFVRPLAEALAGDDAAFSEVPEACATRAPLENRSSRLLFRPGRFVSGRGVEPVPWKGSHDIRGAAEATALLRIEATSTVPAGETVPVYPLPWRAVEESR